MQRQQCWALFFWLWAWLLIYLLKILIILFYFMCLNFKGFYVFRAATTVTKNRTYLKHSVSSFMIIFIWLKRFEFFIIIKILNTNNYNLWKWLLLDPFSVFFVCFWKEQYNSPFPSFIYCKRLDFHKKYVYFFKIFKSINTWLVPR
jgi:hypothetical protein